MAISVLLVGTGEYTTGFGAQSGKTDKGAGVVALTCFDLRRRGIVGDILLAGTNGTKFPAMRAHMQRMIGDAYPGSGYDLRVKTFPGDDVASDPVAYRTGLAALPKGSAVIVFTPDDTHYDIAKEAIAAGMHVLVTKPLVQKLTDHLELNALADKAATLLAVEVHKRWDPLYTDARDRLRRLGDLSFMAAYMSQPKLQLSTFAAWAGKASDISFYLNSHHVDFSEWLLEGRARPATVTAVASHGVAAAMLGRPCEDSITLTVQWFHPASRNIGVATYTASWVAPPSDVHSQQRFFAQCHGGEVSVDQAHRGYTLATDAAGFASPNPLFMKYTPDPQGRFAGQSGYGYRSIETFVAAAKSIAAGDATPRDFRDSLATGAGTLQTTAILQAGRLSLDAGGAQVTVTYASDDATNPHCFEPTSLVVAGKV